MKKILVTGGTVFVSRYIAEYYVKQGYEVYVLNRNTKKQEYAIQPFVEETPLAVNTYWGKYGTDKIEAEATLLKRNSSAYIVRPPYLYGPMNNVYREVCF